MRVIVYVDGFNLYYGSLRGTPYRWLDLGALAQHLLPRDDVVGIKYFTARVVARPDNPDTPKRQDVYLRALGTVPDLSIHEGQFLTTQVGRRLVNPPQQGTAFARVWNTEEKGSDVSLASHLLMDGFRARYDLAVVVSNDSDLKTPVGMVRQELNAPVGVLNPHKRRSWALSPPNMPMGSFYKPIRAGVLAASQFPAELTDVGGVLRKPADW